MKQLALVGKPNSGKSSLFNLLTGLNQKIGNYSGVTVERKTGKILDFEIIDLPGIKSLKSVTLDEKISKDEIIKYVDTQSPILFVANGMHLEDNLVLFSEIADLQVPMMVVINFKDDLEKNKILIDIDKLSDQLACPIMLMNSRNGEGLDQIVDCIRKNGFKIPNAICRSLYDNLENGEVINDYYSKITKPVPVGDNFVQDDFYKRQRVISSIVGSVAPNIDNGQSFLKRSKKWDHILLHPIFGIVFFLAVMMIVFQSVFFLSSFPMDWIDEGFGVANRWARNNISNEWWSDLIVDGVLPGMGGVLIFIPQISILFFILSILEHSGYLSRISYISNRFLSNFNLSGQSVIPLMSSWACAIPAIMGSRVINNPKERLAIIFATPLMTCSARLPVYTILISIMVPDPSRSFFNIQGVLLLGLYLIGVISTLLIAKFVNKRTKGESSNIWSLELPVYRIPNWRNVFTTVYIKTKSFVVEAGKVIFFVSIVLWFIASYSPKSDEFLEQAYQSSLQENKNGSISKDAFDLEYSYAGYLGKIIEPVIEPLGYDWKIGIALITSFAAREVFVGSISTIYSVGSEDDSLIKVRLQNEMNPVTGEPRFNTSTCISLLFFYVFALQCMSTMAIVRKETGSWKYPILQFIVMFIMAYVAAFIGFRLPI